MASTTTFGIALFFVIAVVTSHMTHVHDDNDMDLDVQDLHVGGDSYDVTKTCFPVTMQVCVPHDPNGNATFGHHGLFNTTRPGNSTSPINFPATNSTFPIYKPANSTFNSRGTTTQMPTTTRKPAYNSGGMPGGR